MDSGVGKTSDERNIGEVDGYRMGRHNYLAIACSVERLHRRLIPRRAFGAELDI